MKSIIIIIKQIFCVLACFLCAIPLFAEQGFENHDKFSYELAPVVVTAERIDEYIKNNPQNVISIEREEIKKRNFLDLGEAMSSMPGVDVTPDRNAVGARITIRGGGTSPVLVLVDGRPINSSQYGGVNLSGIPIEIVEKIMVFKPPVPVWLGLGSAAGAVNIVTRSKKEDASVKAENTAQIKASAGSYGAANMSASSILNQDDTKLVLLAGGSRKDGKRPNSDQDSGNISFNWSRKGVDQIQYDINGRYYHSYHGSPGPEDMPTPDARQRYQKGSLDFNMDGFNENAGELSLKTYLDIEDLNDLSQTGYLSTLDVYKAGIKGETVLRGEKEEYATRLGAMFETNQVRHNISGNHDRQQVSVHAQHERKFKEFALNAGLRGEYVDNFGYFPAFNCGLSYALGSKTLLKTNAGYSVEIPTFSQLYQPSHGSIDQVRGNPYLDEEKIYSMDLTLEHKFGQDIASLCATLFRTDTQDMIKYERGEDLIYRPINISRAYRQGMEISYKQKLSDNLSADLSYIYQDTKNRESGNNLAYSPEHQAKITIKYSLPFKTRMEAILKYADAQMSSPDTNQAEKLDSYTIVDIKIIRPIVIKSIHGDIFLNVYNLFDTCYEIHAGYPDDGFRLIAGINISL